ncbi:MAG: hypothetical protein DSM106950_41410 [Stigonema ocellatum SAG 48.90 = DSM 106950]|nr:hypothetical protein [Stigonema ocellatum SAG 48.90 = DSM 106950]
MTRKQEETKKYTMPKGFVAGEKRMRNVPIMYDERKQKFNLGLTPTAIDIIKMIAKNQGTSASEVVERWARGSQEEAVILQKEQEELQAQIATLQEQNQQLQNELNNVVAPPVQDYEAVRDHVLKNWRLAKAPEKKERIKEALDRFIKALHGNNHE